MKKRNISCNHGVAIMFAWMCWWWFEIFIFLSLAQTFAPVSLPLLWFSYKICHLVSLYVYQAQGGDCSTPCLSLFWCNWRVQQTYDQYFKCSLGLTEGGIDPKHDFSLASLNKVLITCYKKIYPALSHIYVYHMVALNMGEGEVHKLP